MIRASLDTFDLPPDGVIRSPAELNEAVAGLIRLRLRSNYQRLAMVLPSLLDELHRAQIAWTGQRGSIATLLLTQAYRAADALADKFGHHDLSARIIAMMTDAARRTGDATVLATAHYVRGELFFENGRPDLGRAVLEKAADEVSTCTGTFAWAAYGALHMRAAVLAGIAQQSEQAKDHLREAGEYAQLVSDGEYHGTAFGPSSVRIHEVTLAVDSDDPDAALRAARGWIPPNGLPGERRSHFYIDLARAHSQTRSTEPACDALFQAKLAAPEHARIHPQVRQVVSDLLPRVTAAHPLHDYVRWMTSTAATG
ncbi:hypothetical protein [Verrucosispora sp. NA02020]|uniref:hypothetical protein n=1 Tax=Verrucosispora sp. NA02020 TaxID=2742132 RepID=UPI001590381B|nr:hypothetical protein [Verrucosispora sp. NA02020]QKW12214.1 hypothetical protein HUT12_04990 [Verrucosispora sp. NA02020]